jgi:predicted RNase H-like nuclease (RuvC/YqgF family)
MSIATHIHTPAAKSPVDRSQSAALSDPDRLAVENARLVSRIAWLQGSLEALTNDNAELRRTVAEMSSEISHLQALEARWISANRAAIKADRVRRVRSMLADSGSRNP